MSLDFGLPYDNVAIFEEDIRAAQREHSEEIPEPPAMHVKISASVDEWHRLTMDVSRPIGGRWEERALFQARTACGEPIGGYYSTREETYTGRLCTRCFTSFERERAALRVADDERERRIEDELAEIQRDKDWQLYKERSDRARTSTTRIVKPALEDDD